MARRLDRREFLAGAVAAQTAARVAAPQPDAPLVAAIVTEYRPYSHADVICGRILGGYAPDNVRTAPRTRLVSMYTDQVPVNDLSRDLAARHGFTIYPTVEGALTLGGSKVAVDAVLLVGEHGNYPTNERGQKMYPRHELFGKIAEVLRSGGRAVPLFSDKHLSYSWAKAKAMYDAARELRLPFMAGSSIPVTIRVPELEPPLGCRIERAVAVGYGDLDAYGFHTLESLQSMVERRAGAEAGIAAVEMLEGEAVWRYRDGPGSWTAALLDAALARSTLTRPGRPESNTRRPALFLLEYRDGFRAAAYMLEGHARDFLFAAQLADRREPVSCLFGALGGRPLPHFDGLVRCIEDLFVTGRPVYPVERTLLVTGALAFLFESRSVKRRVETPELAVAYRAPEHAYFQRA